MFRNRFSLVVSIVICASVVQNTWAEKLAFLVEPENDVGITFSRKVDDFGGVRCCIKIPKGLEHVEEGLCATLDVKGEYAFNVPIVVTTRKDGVRTIGFTLSDNLFANATVYLTSGEVFKGRVYIIELKSFRIPIPRPENRAVMESEVPIGRCDSD